MANMDLMEHVYGWSAQQGEDYLDAMIPEATEDPDSDATSESRQSVPSSSNRARANRKRPRAVHAGQLLADVIRDSIQSRNRILSRKNQLIESHPDISCSQLRAMQVLHSVPSVRMWSPLYKAAIQHLKEGSANRQTFMCYEDDENKVLYLEFATGESRDA